MHYKSRLFHFVSVAYDLFVLLQLWGFEWNMKEFHKTN
jgi:hypothetical protein